MRPVVPSLAFLGLLFGTVVGASACFTDPTSNADDASCSVGEEECMCLANATCFGALECVQGICLAPDGETGDGDGDPGDGDGDPGDGDGDPGDGDGDPGDGDGDPGDGDGDPQELVVLDMFSDACALTSVWTTIEGGNEAVTDCDVLNVDKGGEMLRYANLAVGPTNFIRVLGLSPAGDLGNEVRGYYNLDNLQNPSTLEFRADVLVRCAEGVAVCTGKFALAVAELTQNGLYAEIEDYNLSSNDNPITVTRQLSELVTLSEPSVVLAAEQIAGDTTEVLIVNPRLVLVDP